MTFEEGVMKKFFLISVFVFGFFSNANSNIVVPVNNPYQHLFTSAQMGDTNAQFQLCGMYYQGIGVPQNSQEAARWCFWAASQGHTEAQYNLALMYQYGEGVKRDLNEALKWYEAAANAEHKYAKHNLQILQDTGLFKEGLIGAKPKS